MNIRIRCLTVVSAASIAALLLPGCDGSSSPQAAQAPKAGAHDHDHDHGSGAHAGHDHAHDKPAAGADDHGHTHGATVELGEQQVAGFTARASRDGEIAGATDAPIDVWIAGGTAKVVSVRFWIGAQDAKGSVKAKASLEKDNWHTHAELPSPLPAGSKLWVEFEVEGGAKHLAGFDLKA